MAHRFWICFCLTLLAAASLPLSLYARLDYSPETGWYDTEGPIRSSLSPEDQAKALELMNEAAIRQAQGNLGGAITRYRRVAKRYPESIFAPEARLQTGRLYLQRNQFEKGFREFAEILGRYPEYPKFQEVIAGQYAIAERMARGERPRLWGVIPGFRNYPDALNYYERVVNNAPYGETAPRALLEQARLAKRQDEPAITIDALDRIINLYPESAEAPDAYLMLADTFAAQVKGPYYDQGPTREAISYYRDFLILFPRHREASGAESDLSRMRNVKAGSQYLMGEFYYKKRDNPIAALSFYNAAITVDPESDFAARAREAIEKIREGKLARRTPVDWLFPEFRNPDREPFERIKQGLEGPDLFEPERLPEAPALTPVRVTPSPLEEGAEVDPVDSSDPLDEATPAPEVPVERVQEREPAPIRYRR
ncbi:MAG: tetratricopeptide repeat protein [Opitutales bacterium]